MATTIYTTSKPATIVKYLQDELGIKAPEGATTEELLKLVTENGGKVVDKNEPAETAASDVKDQSNTRVRIKVFERPDADRQLTVGINGVFTTIVRGVEVNVPYAVYDLLKNAVTKQYEQKGDEVIEREVQTDPFTVVKFDVQPGEFED